MCTAANRLSSICARQAEAAVVIAHPKVGDAIAFDPLQAQACRLVLGLVADKKSRRPAPRRGPAGSRRDQNRLLLRVAWRGCERRATRAPFDPWIIQGQRPEERLVQSPCGQQMRAGTPVRIPAD